MDSKNKQLQRTFRDALPLAEVLAQGRLLRVRVVHRLRPQRGRRFAARGAITQFSRASRKRMLELLSRLDPSRAGFPCFVTLTYPDREGPPTHDETERDRQCFFKRMKRRFPLCSGLWRREFQPRKSGAQCGEIYPHYHLLVFNLPFLPHAMLNEVWRSVIGHDGYVRTEIEAVHSWQGAFFYAAKYMAKTDPTTDAVVDGERADAESGALAPRTARGPAPAEGAPGSLVCASYLTVKDKGKTVKEIGDSPLLGRAWGTFNRKCLPYADRHVEHLALGRWLRDAKDLAREVWPRIDELQPQTGFTLFVDDAKAWAQAIRSLHDVPLDEDDDDDGVPT